MPLVGKGTDSRVQQALGDASRELQSIAHTKYDRAPLAGEVPEQGLVWAQISGTVYGYTKLGGQLYRWALTAA